MEWIPVVFIAFKAVVLFTGMFYAIKWHYDQDRKKKSEDDEAQAPTDMRLFATMIIAITISLIGIVYAGCWGDTAEGGRGGALGCAFTFFMLFMSRSKAETVLADHSGKQSDVLAEAEPATLGEGIDQLARLKIQTGHLRAAFVARLESAEHEKIYLGVAGLACTLAWKFGDIAATWLKF